FFFQAEDGIRDKLVTGVQTCALPICGLPKCKTAARAAVQEMLTENQGQTTISLAQALQGFLFFRLKDPDARQVTFVHHPVHLHRSEERRVGKECRSRWAPDH